MANELFIRWMTGPENNLPEMKLTSDDFKPDPKGKFTCSNGIYHYAMESTPPDKRYSECTTFAQRLFRHCLQIEREISDEKAS